MLKFKPMANNETSVCWLAIDYSDGQESHQQFAIRFKVRMIDTFFIQAKIKSKLNYCFYLCSDKRPFKLIFE